MIKRLVVCVVVWVAHISWANAAEVQLYGLIDMGLEFNNVRQSENALAGTPSKALSQNFLGIATGVQSGSRIGFRGQEDLGAGWKVGFTLENGFDPGNGVASQGGRLFGRQSTVSVMSNTLGQLDFGRQINLASNYFLSIDPFVEGFGQANIGASFGSANTTRYANMLMFQTLPMQGLKLGAGYSFAAETAAIYSNNGGCGATQTCNPTNQGYNYLPENNLRVLTLGAQYLSGPILLSAALDRAQGPANIPDGPPPASPIAWIVGGKYDFSLFTLSAAYGQTKNGGFSGQSPGTGAGGGTSGLVSATGSAAIWFGQNYSHTAFMLGSSVPLNSHAKLLASWQWMQPTGEYAEAGNRTQQIISLGYTYQFTVRTNFYALASYAQNFAMVGTAQSSVVGVGIRHMF